MSLRWVEGFEVRRSDDYFTKLYGATSGSWGFPTGRKHGNCAAGFNDSLTTPALVGSPTNTWYVQFDFRKSSNSGASGTILEIMDSGGEQCNLHVLNSPSVDGNFRLEFRRGTTVLETTGDIPAGNSTRTWFVYVLKVVVDTATGGSFELRQYDRFGASTVILNTASVNTANQGTAGADRVKLQVPGFNAEMDNWLVWDDVNVPVGTIFTDFHSGPLLVYGIRPDGEGNQLDWDLSSGGTHWVLVDNDPINASGVDSGEVTSQVVSDVDLYDFGDIGPSMADTPVIRGMTVTVRHRMKNSGTRNLQIRVRDVSLSEADEGTAIVSNSTAVSTVMRIMEENPVTTAAWTEAEIDGVEMGPKLES